jgi:uncharacterized protein (TIGR03437 family)
LIKSVLFGAVFALQLFAQPSVTKGGIFNAASFGLPGLPNSSIAQGSFFSVFGTNLGVTNSTQVTFPLPTSILGTSIKVTVGSTSVDAFPYYTSPTQVNAILPSKTPTGTGTLTLTFNGQSSSTPITVVSSSFGTFSWNSLGSGPGVIQNYVSSTQLTNNGAVTANIGGYPFEPARPGQTLILWGTGLGPVSGDEGAAPPVPVDMKDTLGVEVWVGGKKAQVTYAGRTPCCAAEDQLNLIVPDGIQGCYVSVLVKAGGVVSNGTSVAVAPAPNAVCSDANGIDPANLQSAQSAGSVRLGVVNLSRTQLNIDAGALGKINATADIAAGEFGQFSALQIERFYGVTLNPSVGSCAVSQFVGLDPTPVDPTLPTLVDAGASLSITGPLGNKAIPRTAANIYSATLGGVALNELLTGTLKPNYFDPGTYTVSGGGGTGGNAVGSFSSQITIPAPPTWTNSAQTTNVPRSSDLTVTWTGADPNGFVAITGISAVGGALGPTSTSPGVAFLCIAPGAPGTFTIPSVVLQALPASNTSSIIPTGFLLVGGIDVPVKFSAPNLDAAYVTYRTLIGKNVVFQ